ncbi:FAD-binding oxidoreductase [Mesorhizobium sp. M0204]|uniref:FAD-binding and (Fe-S)-binding domain-containing protein n=1 Tax=Mesorhizobium sp. M0204 TaxID=2956913 RepID=UPI003334C9EA
MLDDLNEQARPQGLFFAPETSTSSRCTVGGMVSTDASGKGSRIYGKTSDNLIGVEIARGRGLLASFAETPEWARPMLHAAEIAARVGRDGFIANTPKLTRRYTGYDLERACPKGGDFEWWRLFPGSEGTLGPITRIRVKLRRLSSEKRLIVAVFGSFRHSLAASVPLLDFDPTAVEVIDERIQMLAEKANLLTLLPKALWSVGGQAQAYTFIEFNGDDRELLNSKVEACRLCLADLPGIQTVHVATDLAEIRELWATRSAGVGLLGKVIGRKRPIAFVEDCVVPPAQLTGFLDGFLEILSRHGLDFGIYGHVDVGCLHIRPALDIDREEDRQTLVRVSDEIFALVNAHGGIFWGEHGKGVRGAYLKRWIGEEAYAAFQGVKAAFDPDERFNPGKLISLSSPLRGVAETPFRAFNAPPSDPLEKAFACNGNAQCLSYMAATPMCPSFKASHDLRHSPKGRADALREWHLGRVSSSATVDEGELLGMLDTCLGCKACVSSCPVQVDIPAMRAAFYSDYYGRHSRPLADRAVLLAERFSPWLMRMAPVLRPFWGSVAQVGELLLLMEDLPRHLAIPAPADSLRRADLAKADLPPRTVLVFHDWFSALFDEQAQRDVLRGLAALGYWPRLVEMVPAGKLANDMGDRKGFRRMGDRLRDVLEVAASRGVPLIGYEPAFVMALRQDFPKEGYSLPEVLLPQEFLALEIRAGASFARAADGATDDPLHREHGTARRAQGLDGDSDCGGDHG